MELGSGFYGLLIETDSQIHDCDRQASALSRTVADCGGGIQDLSCVSAVAGEPLNLLGVKKLHTCHRTAALLSKALTNFSQVQSMNFECLFNRYLTLSSNDSCYTAAPIINSAVAAHGFTSPCTRFEFNESVYSMSSESDTRVSTAAVSAVIAGCCLLSPLLYFLWRKHAQRGKIAPLFSENSDESTENGTGSKDHDRDKKSIKEIVHPVTSVIHTSRMLNRTLPESSDSSLEPYRVPSLQTLRLPTRPLSTNTAQKRTIVQPSIKGSDEVSRLLKQLPAPLSVKKLSSTRCAPKVLPPVIEHRWTHGRKSQN